MGSGTVTGLQVIGVLLCQLPVLGFGIYLIMTAPKPQTKAHTELPSYDEQLAALFHDEQP